MSIYSGFATRALEMSYNKTLYNLLFVLQTKIFRNLKNSSCSSAIWIYL